MGDASKARRKLGWEPTATFKELVRMMVEADIEAAQRETARSSLPAGAGVLHSGPRTPDRTSWKRRISERPR